MTTTRVSGSMSFMAGLMAPRKFDLIRVDYTSATVTNYGYFSVTPSGAETFHSRTQITVDGQSREVEIQLFTDSGGIW